MRLIPFKDLKPGMSIADDLYGINGHVLVRKGTTITEKHMENLISYKIPVLYVIDGYGEEIPANCSITSAMRSEASQNLKKLYKALKEGLEGDYASCLKACTLSAGKIVDDVMSEKINLYDVFDIKMIENYHYQQPVNVMIISLILAKILGFNYLELNELALAAYLHDIGNNLVDESLFHKKEKLSEDDYKSIKKHAELGYKFAKEKLLLSMKTYLGIAQHHERFDGSGYPYKKKGTDINQYARIIAIADIFDALSSKRGQKKVYHPSQAYELIVEGSGSKFDPDLVELFKESVSPFPVGYSIKISGNKIGIVTKNFKGRPYNPMVRIVEENGRVLRKPYVITLGV